LVFGEIQKNFDFTLLLVFLIRDAVVIHFNFKYSNANTSFMDLYKGASMKKYIFGYMIIGLFSTQAQARILGVELVTELLSEGRLIYNVKTEVCPFSFPVLNERVIKISDEVAQIEFDVFPGACNTPSKLATFSLDVQNLLETVGLDANRTKILFRLQ